MNLDDVIQQPGQQSRMLRDAVMDGLHVSVPGRVVSFDKSKGTATIQPTVRRFGKAGAPPLLVDVPVYFPGNYTFRVSPGDEALVVFADSCIDAWYQSGGVSAAMSARTHSLSDGFAFVGFRSNPNIGKGKDLEERLLTEEDREKLDSLPESFWSFEAGTAIPANSDLNNYITAGNYRCESGNIANTISNNPLGANPFVLKVFDAQGAGILIQWVIQGNGARMFLRRYANGAFSDWVRYTTDEATTGSSGYMSAADKTKLDGVETGANNYTHPSYTARTGKPTADAAPGFGGTVIVSQVTSDGQGHVTGMTDRTITIPGDEASTSAKGLMSATDKSVLDTSTVRGSKSAPSGSTSLDQFITSGIYWLSSTIYPNGWPDAEGTGAKNALLNVYYDGGGARVQILTMYSGTGENRMYCRMYINSQWYAWRQITTGAGIAWSLDIGSQIAANSDLDNFKTPGSYTSPTNITPTLTHRPPTTSNAFILKVMVGHVANTVVQYAIDVTGTLISIRYFNTSSWGSWYKYTGTAV